MQPQYMKNISYHPILLIFYHLIIFLLKCDTVQGTIFRDKRSGIIHNWIKTIDPGFKNVERFSGGFGWYMMESNDNISCFCFKSITESNQLVSFNRQSISFRLSIKEF